MLTRDTKTTLQRWYVPTVATLIGIAYLVAGVMGDDLSFGVIGLVLMLATAGAMVLAGRRSETVKGLLDRQDERIRGIDNDASMFAGMVLVVAVIAGFIIEIARGRDGEPYALLGAIAGVSYVGALVVLRLRR